MDKTQSLVFGIAYISVVLFLAAQIPISYMAACRDKRRADTWEYGMYKNVPARRNPYSGRVQFVIWKAGEQGHTSDCWIDYHPTRWPDFVPHARGHV